MDFKTFIQDVAANTRQYIEKFEEYKELSGEQKKARVDDIITDYIEVAIDSLKMNIVFKYFLKKLIIVNVPVITQIIFDLIKTKIEGITK